MTIINGKPVLGWCSNHPKEPAVATEKVGTAPKRKFCQACWDHHRVTALRHSPTFDARSLMGQGVKRFGFVPVAEMTQAKKPKSTKIPYKTRPT